MKTILYLLFCVTASAYVTVHNRGPNGASFNGSPVGAGATEYFTYVDSYAIVDYGPLQECGSVVSLLDGSIVVICDDSVSAVAPVSSWVELFLKGFFLGCMWEAFGLLIRVVRAVKSQRAEVV